MLHSLKTESRDPARKKRSSVGWKAIEVTKSLCLKVHRHSCLLICQRRTVLSMDDERRKLFLLQLRSKISPVCPSNSRMGFDLKTGALSRSPPDVLEDTSSSCSCACLSFGVEITAHILTT